MKKLFVMLLSIALVTGASAQHRGAVVVRPHVVVSAPIYPYYGYGYGLGFGYPYYPPYAYGYNSRPSKMEMEIQDIKNDYQDKINSARDATDLTGRQRRQRVRELKEERDQAIENLRRNYYKQ